VLVGVSLAVWWASPIAWASANRARVMIAVWVGSGDQVPLVGRGGLGAVAGGLAAAAEHHVPGVFGVAQDRADGGFGPVHAVGWRVPVFVGVEPGGDGGDAEVFFDPPRVDHGDDGAAHGVKDQAGFGAALGGFHWHGVGYPFGLVPVGGGADVPSGDGVLPQSFPCFLLDLQPEVLGNALLDPAH
jgi:hypothetical protein